MIHASAVGGTPTAAEGGMYWCGNWFR